MLNKLLLIILFASCSTTRDPLKNTKKLMKEGHASLYNNGAFQIPSTKIKLIPPGPDAIQLAKEMTGVGAKASFLEYINEVKESSVVIYEGTKKTYKFSRKVDKAISDELSSLGPKLRKNSVLIMNSYFAASKSIVGSSWDTTKSAHREIKSASHKFSQPLREVDLKQSTYTAYDNFILGYLQVPEKLHKRTSAVDEALTLNEFAENYEKSKEFREVLSKKTTYLIKDSFKNYENDVTNSLHRMDGELAESNRYGIAVPVIKSLVWLIEGIVWQGMIKPIGKLTAGAIGYTVVNGIAFPVYLVTRNGVTTGKIAVEVTKQTASGIYEVTAPSFEIALSSLLYSGEFLTKQTVEKTSNVTGFVLDKSVEYIAAPIAAGVVGTSQAISGVAVGVGGGVLAGSTRGTGEALVLSSQVISKTTAAVTFVGGVTLYTLKGTGEVLYEITKATVVPPGLILGSGLTLSYGTVSQLAAQSVLAASDAAYLVLSLEGPSYVVYAIQGKLGREDIPAGTVLDLNRMRANGEVIKKLPVDDESMNKIIKELAE